MKHNLTFLPELFKITNITISVVSPAQNVHLTVIGISCKEWMEYFVRFQTGNGTKKTQQGICKDSIVSCYVPGFPPNTRLRVGLTLSNRLVQWADKRILIQCNYRLRTQTYFRLLLVSAENNVCEPEPGNSFYEVGILSQSHFSSSNILIVIVIFI